MDRRYPDDRELKHKAYYPACGRYPAYHYHDDSPRQEYTPLAEFFLNRRSYPADALPQ